MPRKKELRSTYGDKIIRVFSTSMYARRPFSTSELMELLKCSKQTVRRLIRDIETVYGIQLEITKRGRENCYELKPTQRPRTATLSEEEMDLLWLMRGDSVHGVFGRGYLVWNREDHVEVVCGEDCLPGIPCSPTHSE
jgi:hypothetical protein